MRMTLVVPGKYLEAIAYAKERMSLEFGGTTTYNALGTWVDPQTAEIVDEHVRVIETFTPGSTPFTTEHDQRVLYDIAGDVHEMLLDEQTIMYTIDNQSYFTER